MRALLAVAVMLASCAELPQLPRGTCGNAVIEEGEECDTFGRDGFACRKGDPSLGGCRIECNSDHACPVGYGCGLDLVCRRPSGTFAFGSEVRIPVDARRVDVGDFDGDRRADPFTQTIAELRVHYFDGKSDPARSASIIGVTHAISALGSKTSLATLAVGHGNTLSVWRGQPDRTLATTLYPALPVSPLVREARIFVANALPATQGPPFIGSEFLLVTSTGPQSARLDLGLPEAQSLSYLDLTMTPRFLVGPVFGAFYPLRPCDVMAYSYGQPSIDIFPLCAIVTGAPNNTRAPSGSITTLKPVRALAAAAVDADKRPDLVIQPQASGAPLEVAYSSPIEGFHSIPNAAGADMKTSILPWGGSGTFVVQGVMLAAGDLDGDKKVDIIDSVGVHLSSIAADIAIPLTSAVIKDANRDGLLDAIAIGPFGQYFFVGTGSALLNTSFNAVDGTPTKLVVADFDGDLVDDVLVGSSVGSGVSQLSVSWGRALQIPEAPVAVGTLPSIEDMAGGPIAPHISPGTTSSIGVAPILVRRNGLLESPVLFGSASRVLESPLAITKLGPGLVQRGTIAAIMTGRFGNDHDGIAMVAYDDDALHAARLWSTRVTGDAEIDPVDLVRSTEALPIQQAPSGSEGTRWWDGPLATTIDLEGDGIDELVMLATPDAAGSNGSLLVSHVKDISFSTIGQPIGAALPNVGVQWSVRKTDVDGDGRLDLVLVYTDETKPIAKLFLNRGAPSIDIGATIDIPLPADPITDLTALRVTSTTNARSIVMATNDKLWVTRFGGTSFGPLQEMVDREGKSAGGATSLATGDVDGDGLDDLVLTRDHGVYVVFQEEKKP